MQAQSTGEDSNSSDTAMSDRGGHMSDIIPKLEPNDYGGLDDNLHHHGNGIGLDPQRTPSFPAALLGLQGDCYDRLIITVHYVQLLKLLIIFHCV